MQGQTILLEESSLMAQWWEAIAGIGTLIAGRSLGTWSERRKAEKEDKESQAKMLKETQEFIFSSMQADIIKLKERRDKDEAKSDAQKDRIDKLVTEVSELKLSISNLSMKNDELIQERDRLNAAIIDLKDKLRKVQASGTELAVSLQMQIEFAKAELSRVSALYREATGEEIPDPEPGTPEQEKVRARLAEERIAKKMEEEYLKDEFGKS